MIGFEKFLEDNPDMAEKPYGDAMAALLSCHFPAKPNERYVGVRRLDARHYEREGAVPRKRPQWRRSALR